MAEITHNELGSYLQGLDPAAGRAPPAVVLIHGEERIVQGALERLLGRLLPEARGSLNYEPFDGASADIGDVLARMNTFPLLPGPQVVVLKAARIFHGKDDAARLLSQARKAYAEGDLARAARSLLAALSQLGLTLEEARLAERGALLPAGADVSEDDGWIEALCGYCSENGLSIPPAADAAGMLQRAVEKGFPPGNHLIITTEGVDRRRSVYSALNAVGLIVDCSVPKGEGRADRQAQEAVLSAQARAALAPHGKFLEPDAFQALCEMTGFNLGVFANNLEILIDYAGERREITAADVAATLARTKKDPIFEFTNALTDRNLDSALFFLGNLLGGEVHPLQALAAMANQVRKLLAVKEFTSSPEGALWQRGCSFQLFQKSVMPAVLRHDREFIARLEAWEEAAAAPSAEGKKRKKPRAATDLVLARNPGSAYPVFILFKKAESFSREELLAVIQRFSAADVELKSSPLPPRLILERVVWQICQQQG